MTTDDNSSNDGDKRQVITTTTTTVAPPTTTTTTVLIPGIDIKETCRMFVLLYLLFSSHSETYLERAATSTKES